MPPLLKGDTPIYYISGPYLIIFPAINVST